MLCDWSPIRLLAFHLPAPLPLICMLNFIFLDLKFRLGLCWHTILGRYKHLAQQPCQGEAKLPKGWVLERVQHVAGTAFYILLWLSLRFLPVRPQEKKKKSDSNPLETSVSILDYSIGLHVCIRENMTLDAMLGVCTKGFAMCHANLTWK